MIQVGFNDEGKIDALTADVFCDPGMSSMDATSLFACMFMQSCYTTSGWKLNPGVCTTDTHANTFCRAPGKFLNIY